MMKSLCSQLKRDRQNQSYRFVGLNLQIHNSRESVDRLGLSDGGASRRESDHEGYVRSLEGKSEFPMMIDRGLWSTLGDDEHDDDAQR